MSLGWSLRFGDSLAVGAWCLELSSWCLELGNWSFHSYLSATIGSTLAVRMEGSDDKKSVTRIDPQKCGRCVPQSCLRPELASETA